MVMLLYVIRPPHYTLFRSDLRMGSEPSSNILLLIERQGSGYTGSAATPIDAAHDPKPAVELNWQFLVTNPPNNQRSACSDTMVALSKSCSKKLV